jgi:predicted phage terminase large subunit-like protein
MIAPNRLPRWKCLLDPVAFIAHCLRGPRGKALEMPPVHVELQRMLSQERHALVELPRDHGKSTQICGRVLWELGRNPGLRVKIICATDDIARQRCLFLRDAIDNNPAVHEVFPELVATSPWRADEFTIERPGDVIGPSVAAFGVGAGSTGTRADLLICDDVVDVRSLYSQVDRERVVDYFNNNLMNLLEPAGRCWVLFTPWHLDDLNARLKRNETYSLMRRPVGQEMEPVWSRSWPAKMLNKRKKEIGAASFARGYHLVPVSEEETPIRPAWVQYWSEPAAYEEIILAVDPAVSGGPRADRSALVVLGKVSREATASLGEPATLVAGSSFHPATHVAGSPGMVGGECAASRIHVLACTARRVQAPELVALIDEFNQRYNPWVILFESNAAFQGIKDLLARQTRFGAKLKSVTQSAPKAARVAAFSVAVENGAFRLKGANHEPDPTQRELFEEMVTFPFGEHDDLLDAAATGTAYLLNRREPRIW